MRKMLSEVLVFGLLLILASGARAQDQSVRHVVLRAGRILDVKTGHVLTDQAIVIDGDKIVSVGPGAGAKVAAGGTVIDLPDATVLPGLIELIPTLPSTRVIRATLRW